MVNNQRGQSIKICNSCGGIQEKGYYKCTPKDTKEEESSFSDFIRAKNSPEKEKIMMDIIKEANQEQKDLMSKVGSEWDKIIKNFLIDLRCYSQCCLSGSEEEQLQYKKIVDDEEKEIKQFIKAETEKAFLKGYEAGNDKQIAWEHLTEEEKADIFTTFLSDKGE